MQVVVTLVDGMVGHVNRINVQDVTYLPISMGYCTCYKRYMALLGYNVQTMAMGKYIVEGENGKEIDSGEYINFHTYYYRWRGDFPNLKVSRPVEDICPYCNVFADCHRYVVTCVSGRGNEDGNNGYDNEGDQGNDNGKLEQDGLNIDDNDCDNGNRVTNFSSHGMTARVDVNRGG
jgi:hypothetical protein